MSYGNNPFQSPLASGSGGQNSGYALGKVKPFALTLMITMGVMMLLVVVGIVLNLLGMGFAAQAAQAADDPNMAMMMMQGTIGLVSSIIGLAIGGFIMFACSKMMKLESYGMAMTATILAMIPCISPCCLLGLPIGIWGIVILNDPQVKAAFRG
ncbi:MAG: hypothetical protein ABL888_15115 [Pirellulaceae bacterium]